MAYMKIPVRFRREPGMNAPAESACLHILFNYAFYKIGRGVIIVNIHAQTPGLYNRYIIASTVDKNSIIQGLMETECTGF